MDCLEQQLADALREGTFDYSRIGPDFITAFLSGYFHFMHELRCQLRADLRNVITENEEQAETLEILRRGCNGEETHQ